MDNAKESSPSSSSKSELFIITPDELQKLGLLKGTSLSSTNSKTTKFQTEGISKREKDINVPNEPIILNPHVCKSYFKKDPRKGLSPSKTSKPEILNSKVCLPITSDVDLIRIKNRTLECVAVGQKDKKITSDNLKHKLIDSKSSLAKYKNIKVHKKGNEGSAQNDKETVSQAPEIETIKEDHLKEISINKNSSYLMDKALSDDRTNTDGNCKRKRPKLVDESATIMLKNEPRPDETTFSSNESIEQIPALMMPSRVIKLIDQKLVECKNDVLEEITENENRIGTLENSIIETITEKSIDTLSSECVKNDYVVTEKSQLTNELTAVNDTEVNTLTIKRLDNLTAPVVIQSEEELKTSQLATSSINPGVVFSSTLTNNAVNDIPQSETNPDLPNEEIGIKHKEQPKTVVHNSVVPNEVTNLRTHSIDSQKKSSSDGTEKINELIEHVSDVVAEEQIDNAKEKIIKTDKSQSSKDDGEIPQTPLNDKNASLNQKVIEDETCGSQERGREKKVEQYQTSEVTQLQLNKQSDKNISEHYEDYSEYQEANATKKSVGKIQVEENDSIIVEIPKTPDTPELQTPKKRGRKKKSDIFVNEISRQDILKEPEIKIPRKRGRPRKQQVTDIDQSHQNTPKKECNIFETSLVLEESKTGRKRKKVDYFAMENNLYELEIENLKYKRKKSHSFSSDDEEIERIEKKISQKRVRRPIAKDIVKKIEASQSSSSDDDEPLINKSKKLHENSVSKEDMPVEECEEDNGAISSSNEADQSIKIKYNRTGETSRMMKSIFSAAFKITPTIQIEDPAEKLDIPAIEPNLKRGRPKKDEEPLVNVDSNGNVTCAVCEEKMNNDNWKEHNVKEHYNLSWREGELPLRLDEDIFLRKTLKPVLVKYKQLQCKKCNHCSNVLNDFIAHRDLCLGLVVGGIVTCAVCNSQVDKKTWIYHKLKKHNNLAWRVGDKPLNLNNQNFVLSVLNALYKAKKPLYCGKCGTTKKSVVGFLSHQAQCGISEVEAKVKCEFCDKLVLPVSMPTHIKMIHEIPQNVVPATSIDEASVQAGLRKRKAAIDAMVVIDAFTRDKIEQEQKTFYIDNLDFQANGDFIRECLEQELEANKTIKCKFRDCQYQSEDQELFLEHMNKCGSKPNQYYACLRCLLVTLTEKDMRDHVRSAHKSEMDGNFDSKHSEYEEEELIYKAIMKRRRQDMSRLSKDSYCKVKPAFLSTVFKKNRSLFSSAFEYTLEFCNEHYTQSTIFNKLNYSTHEWQPLEHDQLERYLPKSEISCEVSRYAVKNIDKILTSDQTFKRYELFESQQEDGHTTIYCGGPILALAWLPTPHMYLQCKQVLAVVAGNSFNAKYTINSNYSEATVIQFWYFDILKNKTKSVMPSLMFCLAVDIGPVWHLEWCPSGCYNEGGATNDNKLARMGLLAVAGSDSTVHIYAVPFLTHDQMGVVYKPKPLLKLKLLEDDKRKYFPTRISWSKASGHRHLSVGYTNGMVAIFDLETTSKLLRFKDESGVDVLLPYNSISAHKHYISVLSMIHLKGGTNWLLTGSFDRDFCLWDMKNNTNFTMHRKKIISDGAWFTNWVSHIHTIEESGTCNRLVNATVSSHRHYMYDPVSVIHSASSITSVSTSDWLNGIIQGSSVGEISSSFPHQILYCLDSDKTIRYLRYFFGCTRLVPRLEIGENGSKADSCSNKPLTYDAATKQYGLVFCDMKMDNYADFSPKIQERFTGNYDILKLSDLDMYPMQAINKIAFNPNCQASLYYAAGYQAGFVRLTYLKFLENDRQVV